MFRIKFVWDVGSVSRLRVDRPVSHGCVMSRAFSIKFLRDVTSVSGLWDNQWCRADVGCPASSA